MLFLFRDFRAPNTDPAAGFPLRGTGERHHQRWCLRKRPLLIFVYTLYTFLFLWYHCNLLIPLFHFKINCSFYWKNHQAASLNMFFLPCNMQSAAVQATDDQGKQGNDRSWLMCLLQALSLRFPWGWQDRSTEEVDRCLRHRDPGRSPCQVDVCEIHFLIKVFFRRPSEKTETGFWNLIMFLRLQLLPRVCAFSVNIFPFR